MTDIEVALTDLGEIFNRELAKEHRLYGLEENKMIAKMGGILLKLQEMIYKENLESLLLVMKIHLIINISIVIIKLIRFYVYFYKKLPNN